MSPPGKGVYKVGTPYQINGVWYYPAEDSGYDETGIASWYGPQFHGKATANGEIFDMNGLSAAHKTLPMPSVVQVTNLENGRSMKLRLNDRGPFAHGRIIDLSRRAAQLLGFMEQGTAKVRVQYLNDESAVVKAEVLGLPPPQDRVVASTAEAAPRIPVSQEEALAPPPGSAAEPRTAPPPPPASGPVVAETLPSPVEQMPVAPPTATQMFVQAGAFANEDLAVRLSQRLAGLGQVRIMEARVNGRDFFRVRLGPLAEVSQADVLLERVITAGYPGARIVVD
ncbi:MAG: septal ring lytic transglycosylase RlpA family protein [Acetobacterales bacterium]